MTSSNVAAISTGGDQRAPSSAVPHWIDAIARFGFAARGLLYFIMGGLAGRTAAGASRRTRGIHGTLETIWQHPAGTAILTILAAGFTAFAVTMFVIAVQDLNGEGRSLKAWFTRGGTFVFGGFGHLGLAGLALSLLVGFHHETNDEHETRMWTQRALAYPLGWEVVAGVGIGILGYGLFQLRKAWTADLDAFLDLSTMSESGRWWTMHLGRLGMLGRAIMYGTMGIFLLGAAWHENAHDAVGMGGALHAMSDRPGGAGLLGVVAAGLVAYGIFLWIEAGYRRFGYRPMMGAGNGTG